MASSPFGGYYTKKVWPSDAALQPTLVAFSAAHFHMMSTPMSRQIFAIPASFFSPSAAIRKGKNAANTGRIVHTDIVGYAPAELQKNGLTAGSCFVPVSGEGMIDLTELKVTGYEGETKAKVEIQTLNDAGGTEASYYWYDYTNTKGKHIIGWFDDEDELVEEGVVTVEPGAGLWSFCAADGFNFVWPGVDVK